jgi:hypothetical protein
MTSADFERQYEENSDEELLRLSLQPDDLVPDARIALRAELARRGIAGDERLAEFRRQESKREAELARNPGSLFVIHPGMGRARFGRAGLVRDGDTERFRTTVFVILFWLPLFPTGTFLVERKGGSGELRFIERLPLDWEQVLSVWVVASAALLGLIWVFKLGLFVH